MKGIKATVTSSYLALLITSEPSALPYKV